MSVSSQKTSDRLLDGLATRGWHVEPDFLDPALIAELREVALSRQSGGRFHAAGVGAGQSQVIQEIRGDQIEWLEADDPAPAVQGYLAAMEQLRQAVNATLYLGLFELEAHFALYPPGAGYKRHLDRFRDDDRRSLTAIVYLNAEWCAANGGALRFYPDDTGPGLDILPTGGTLVTFLSDRFWHEVLPGGRDRLALTGWFKRR